MINHKLNPSNPELASALRGYLLAANAIRDAMDAAVNSANDQTFFRYAGYRQFILRYAQLLASVAKTAEINIPLTAWDVSKVPIPFDTPGIQQQEYFSAVYTDVSLLIAFLENSIGVKEDERRSLRDFFQANLRRAVFTEPEGEIAIQDVIEQLLIGRGMSRGVDYDRESGRVKVSIKEMIPDFIVPRLCMAIEVKLSKDKPKSKLIVDEINADIKAYGLKYAALLFVVYDLGSIQDEAAFRRGLETPDGTSVQVIVVKH